MNPHLEKMVFNMLEWIQDRVKESELYSCFLKKDIPQRDTTHIVNPPSDFENPYFEEKDTVHNWKNYISEEIKEMWVNFTRHQKAAIPRNAYEIATSENWDW